MIYDLGRLESFEVASNGRFTTQRQKLAAIVDRDAAAEGAFFYGVKTTGVYCRPTCRSRSPLPANVVFFDSCGSAERAGYRPCKRCTPEREGGASPHRGAVLDACRRMENPDADLSLNALAEQANLSPHHFQRVFKKIVGVTPKQYAIGCKTRRFQSELRQGERVTDAIYGAGFGSSSRAYEAVATRIGMAPCKVRRGGVGVAVRYCTAETDLGTVLIAATERGVCAIEFISDKNAATARVACLFPHADRIPDSAELKGFASAVSRFVESPGAGLDLPLDIRGTVFQQQVWQALRRIPAGETLSYAKVAESIGRSEAARAVAGACADNQLALAIPCHRVVRSDGKLGGYRWGLERKKSLLARERTVNG